MEELQEADVLWPETPPPPPSRRDHLLHGLPPPALVVHDTATAFTSSSSSSPTPTSTALLFGRPSDDASMATRFDDDDEEFQEADVLWPDDVDEDTARDQLDDVGEFWWLCRDFGEAGSGGGGGEREVWRPSLSSPIDIPTLLHRRRR
uniref:Uncharacterized protein n=1 Tax=Oryza brachyantha TaxID=4533 RepID=J3M8X8_ORYBR